MNMKIEQIEFINESDQFFYDKEKQCWVGYVCFNYRYNYYFEIREDRYTILDNGEGWLSKEEQQEALKEFIVNETVKTTFENVVLFTNFLKEIKEMKEFKVKENTIDYNNEESQERNIVVEGFPILFEFCWDKISGASELSLRTSPIWEDKETGESLNTWNAIEFLGEEFIRNLWKEAIKEDKNRLRMIHCSIV